MLRAKTRLWIEILLHIVFWAAVFYVLTSINSSHIHVFPARRSGIITRDQIVVETPISTYVYIILLFLMALFYGNIFLVFPKAIRYKNGIIRLTICAGWFMMVFGANYFAAGPLFNKANPMPNPRNGLSANKQHTVMSLLQPQDNVPRDRFEAVSFFISDWQHIQPVILFAFLVILGISLAYFFLNAWAKSELLRTQSQANQLSTEIKFLKSQINPHFLFNTLNNLFSMAQEKGNDELADGISKLSGMMRYMLYDSNEEKVPLGKEITYLEECITLNKLRYADEEAKVTFEHTGKSADIAIAPMLFVPFVENAFKHGVAIGKRTEIQIGMAVSGRQLNFNCINTDHSAIKKMEMKINGIGLENVRRRLELVYPGKHRLIINKEAGKFIVNLDIDL